jgi:hypothetical protein
MVLNYALYVFSLAIEFAANKVAAADGGRTGITRTGAV